MRRRLSPGLSVFDFNLLYRRFVRLLLKGGRKTGRKRENQKAKQAAAPKLWTGKAMSNPSPARCIINRQLTRVKHELTS